MVRSYFTMLRKLDKALSFPRQSIWQVKAKLQVAFFTWMALLGKVQTVDNQRK